MVNYADALTSTQMVVLATINDPLKSDWLYGELRREIPGIHFSRATLNRLARLGLIDQPLGEREGWAITETGKLILAEAGMNRDSRLFSWEQSAAVSQSEAASPNREGR